MLLQEILHHSYKILKIRKCQLELWGIPISTSFTAGVHILCWNIHLHAKGNAVSITHGFHCTKCLSCARSLRHKMSLYCITSYPTAATISLIADISYGFTLWPLCTCVKLIRDRVQRSNLLYWRHLALQCSAETANVLLIFANKTWSSFPRCIQAIDVVDHLLR